MTRDDLAFRSGGRIGFALRKDSPELAGALNGFFKDNQQGTLHGNILIDGYLRDFGWTGNALALGDFERFREVAENFSSCGKRHGVD